MWSLEMKGVGRVRPKEHVMLGGSVPGTDWGHQ